MRIAHVVNDVSDSGNGIINVAVDLAIAQRALGHTVWMLSGGGDFEVLLASHGVTCLRLCQTRTPAMLASAVRTLRAFIRSSRPDVMHAHMMTGAVLCRLVLLTHRAWLVCTVHNSWQRSSVLMGVGDRVIAVSSSVRAQMVARGVPAGRVVVVRNGTIGSARRRASGEVRPKDLQHPALLTVAGMNTRKGISDLLGAFAMVVPKHPDAHLYLVGDGPERAQFERQARDLGLDAAVSFEGYQRRPEAYLLAADIFVLASHADPFPLVLAEARSAGCAIVASDVDGVSEALEGGRAGLLFPARDRRALYEHLHRLLSDEDERHHWASEARENIAWLSVERATAETLAVYQGLIDRRRSRSGRRRC